MKEKKENINRFIINDKAIILINEPNDSKLQLEDAANFLKLNTNYKDNKKYRKE